MKTLIPDTGGKITMHERRASGSWALVGLIATLLLSVPIAGQAQESTDFFRQNCFSCHTIGGGRLVGPDLKDVGERRDTEWLVEFILNPQAKIKSGDPYAQKLLEEARGVVMPAVPGISRDRAEALIAMITEESGLEESQFAGSQISDRPFTPDDIIAGREIFLGKRNLASGGPACISCHTVHELGGLSGGRLGPDLTKVYERIGSRPALAAWLQGPSTTTMRPVFAGHPMDSEEILALVAFFESTAQAPADDTAVPMLNFFLIGLFGTALALAALDGLWRRRFRAVRRPLVDAS
jgi:mono/diheme cytochrome c family protein